MSIDRSHPEGTCEYCGGPNVVWFAPSEIWNAVAGDRVAILCPKCFIDLAEESGVIPTAWEIKPERIDAPVANTDSEDAARLDWLDKTISSGNGRYFVSCLPGGLRSAIDAARTAQEGKS